jgi:MFS-type transporter involved in bile tolerance (Atg22 family)
MTQDDGDQFEKFVVGDAEAPPPPPAALDGDGKFDDVAHDPPSTAASASTNADAATKRQLSRSLSISEQAQTYHANSAPSFLRWIEYPFRIKNVTTGEYLEEATGHAMDVSARGPINQTGSFIGSAMLRMAAIEAGGPNMPIYGIKSSSLLTVATIIVGVVAGISMPFVGALVDHTDHRRFLGAASAFITVAAVGLQTMINQNTWFACFLLEIIGGYFLIMHQVCALAYLPDLTHDLVAMGHYTAVLMMNQYFVQGVFTSCIIGAGTKMNNLEAARLAAGLSCSIGVVLMGYAWTFLFRNRPKLREIPAGNNLLTTGFKQLRITSKYVFRDYHALKWFMIALLFSPEGGNGVILAIAVTFLTFFVEMSVQEIAIVSIIMLFSNIPGALLSRKMCKLVNPLNSFRMAIMAFAITNGLIATFVTGSTNRDKSLMYFFAALAGMSFGWMFPSQKTLTVALIPKGQEFEIMGLISFFSQIIGFGPVLVFTALNEAGYSMRWGLASLSFFLLTSFICTLMCGSYNKAIESVAHTSENFLKEYARRNSNKEEGSLAVNQGDGLTKTAVTESGHDKVVE